jgi:glycosyltransferase involved in cell wall biosynthesis
MSTNVQSSPHKSIESNLNKFLIICATLSWILGAHVWIMEIFGGNLTPVFHVMLISVSIFLLWLSFMIIPLEGPLIGFERGSQFLLLFFIAIGGYFSFLSSDNALLQTFLSLQRNIDFLAYGIILLFLIGNISIGLNLAARNVKAAINIRKDRPIRSLSDRLVEEGRSAPKVSFVIPALNEENAIVDTLRGIPYAELKKRGFETEIIVADNGSEDRTAMMAAGCGAKVVFESQKGYGNAYKAGFAAATGDIIVMSDADGTYPVEKTFQLIKPIMDERADVVIGSRFLGTIKTGAMPFLHKIGNRLLTLQLNLLFAFPFKKRVTDAHSGFRAFHADALRNLELTTSGMEFASELVIESYSKSLRMAEIPIDYSPRTQHSYPKLRTFRDGARHFLFMLNTRVTGQSAARFFNDKATKSQKTLRAVSEEEFKYDLSKFALTFLIPAFNEEKSIAPLLKQISFLYPSANIILVNNNSTDRTASVAKRCGATVIHENKQGKANAVLLGMNFIQKSERSDIVVMLDADMTYFPKDAKKLLHKLLHADFDIIIGSRLRGSRTPNAFSSMSLFGNIGLSFLARILYRQELTDVCSGYWAFRGRAIDQLLEEGIESNGFALEAELVAKAARSRLRIGEVPVRYSQRVFGNSSLRKFRDGSRIMKTLFKFWHPTYPKRTSSGKRVLK